MQCMHGHTRTPTQWQCLCLAQHLSQQQAARIIGREAPAEGLLPQPAQAQDSPANQPRTKQHSGVEPTEGTTIVVSQVAACCTCQAAPLLSEVKQSKVKRSNKTRACMRWMQSNCIWCNAALRRCKNCTGRLQGALAPPQKKEWKVHAAINAAVAATPLGAARAKAVHPSQTPTNCQRCACAPGARVLMLPLLPNCPCVFIAAAVWRVPPALQPPDALLRRGRPCACSARTQTHGAQQGPRAELPHPPCRLHCHCCAPCRLSP